MHWDHDDFEGYGSNFSGYGGYKYKREIIGVVSLYDKSPNEQNQDEYIVTYTSKDILEALSVLPGVLREEGDNGYFPSKELLEEYRLEAGKHSVPVIRIHKGRVPFRTTSSRHVATCAFSATEGYLKNILGRNLDNDDRDWYTCNSLVTRDGLPQDTTFTVLQQLVEPYGLGISHIQVPPNSRRFPLFNTFINSLGANPLFKADGKTTNEEAFNQLYPPVVAETLARNKGYKSVREFKKATLAEWKFEAIETPVPPYVLMVQFNTKSVGHNGGSSYHGPRAKPVKESNWLMAVKFAPTAECNRHVPLDIPEYTAFEGDKEPDWWSIKVGEKSLREYANSLKPKSPTGYVLHGPGWKYSDPDSSRRVGSEFPLTEQASPADRRAMNQWLQDILENKRD